MHFLETCNFLTRAFVTQPMILRKLELFVLKYFIRDVEHDFHLMNKVFFQDFDSDGWQELLVTADFGSSRMFWNNKNNTFTECTKQCGLKAKQVRMVFDQRKKYKIETIRSKVLGTY